MAAAKPPPLPTRKPPTPGRSRARNPVPSQAVFTTDEEPTKRQGIEFQVALLSRYYREMDPVDRVTLLRNAEQWAARNRK